MRYPRVPRNPNAFPRPPANGGPKRRFEFNQTGVLVCIVMMIVLFVFHSGVNGLELKQRFTPPAATQLLPTPHRQQNAGGLKDASPTAIATPLVATLLHVPDAAAQVRTTIDRANEAWATALNASDSHLLDSIARGPWLDEERQHIAANQQRNIREHYVLHHLDILSVEVGSATATACTQEHWLRGVLAPNDITEHFDELLVVERYTLLMDNNAWYVSRVEYGVAC